MAIKVVKKPVVADVEVEQNNTVTKQEKVPVSIADVQEPAANVGFSAAYTKNLGNFESLKLTVSLYMPVRVSLALGASNEAAIDKAFAEVQAWVDQKVNGLLDELND